MATEPFIGQLQLFAFGIVPKGWTPCNGQILPINPNQALFSLLGTTFGGNGTTTFGLPNLQGRTAVGVGGDAAVQLGQTAGSETYMLHSNEVLPHSHGLRGTLGGQNQSVPNNNLLAGTPASVPVYRKAESNLTQLNNASVSTVGGQPHENRSPYLVMQWCIALVGIYPSRS